MCRRTPQDFKLGHFTLLFHKERQSNVSKWKIHVRGEVISRCYFMKWKRCTSVACIACENHCFCSLNMQITVYLSCENAIYGKSVTSSWSSTSSSRKLHCSKVDDEFNEFHFSLLCGVLLPKQIFLALFL